jgi:hypothetical protein
MGCGYVGLKKMHLNEAGASISHPEVKTDGLRSHHNDAPEVTHADYRPAVLALRTI